LVLIEEHVERRSIWVSERELKRKPKLVRKVLAFVNDDCVITLGDRFHRECEGCRKVKCEVIAPRVMKSSLLQDVLPFSGGGFCPRLTNLMKTGYVEAFDTCAQPPHMIGQWPVEAGQQRGKALGRKPLGLLYSQDGFSGSGSAADRHSPLSRQ